MREIKFRGKVKYNGNHYFSGEWVYGHFYSQDDEKFFILDSEEDKFGNARFKWVEVEGETVGEYTGLRDKNVKEWYEGDKTDIEDDTFAVVVFEEGTFCFKWYEVCERGQHEYIETCPMTHYHYDQMQIDGNIHEGTA